MSVTRATSGFGTFKTWQPALTMSDSRGRPEVAVVRSNRRKWHKPAVRERAEHVRSAQGISDINLFRYCKGVIDFDAEVPDRAFDLGVPEQKLHSP
jgi:hypothetical protein